MQVISSQCSISSARETSRSRKKGLSLTSRSRCNSQQKQPQTEETFQTTAFNLGQTHTSIKLETAQQKISWLNQNSRQTYKSVGGQKTLADMPKITFRYTNESGKSFEKGNIFSGQFSTITNSHIGRGRSMNTQEPRKVVISHSVETKNLSQSKIDPQSYRNDANPSKQLIDSRRIDREIFEEKVIALLPPIDQQIIQANASLIQKSPVKLNFQVHNEPQSSQFSQKNEHKSGLFEQNLSPYHLLASSTKKYERKELSPGTRDVGSLQIISLEKIPQVQEFNLNQNEDEDDGEAIIDKNSFSQKERTTQAISISDRETYFIEQISVRVSEPVSQIQSQNLNRITFDQTTEQTALTDKVQNSIKVPVDFESKSKSKSPSPTKKNKQNIQNYVLTEIENRAPQTQQVCTMSGRRNMKRIKEIEKRLEEIISICNHNL